MIIYSTNITIILQTLNIYVIKIYFNEDIDDGFNEFTAFKKIPDNKNLLQLKEFFIYNKIFKKWSLQKYFAHWQ